MNLKNYPETCPQENCGQPARSELVTEAYPNENDLYFFCINPKCINYDGAHKTEPKQIELIKEI